MSKIWKHYKPRITFGGFKVFQGTRKKTLLLCTFLVVFFVVSFLWLGYIIGLHMGNSEDKGTQYQADNKKEPSNLSSPDNGSLENSNIESLVYNETIEEITTSPNTVFVFKTLFSECGHVDQKSYLPVAHEVGLTKEQIANLYPGWSVDEFNCHQIVIKKTINNYCLRHYMLKNQDRYVAVYQPDIEGSGFRFIQKTKIRIEWLPQNIQSRIYQQYIIITLEELESIIEDFES